MVITAKNKNIRIWERPDHPDIICDASNKKGNSIHFYFIKFYLNKLNLINYCYFLILIL